MKFKTTFVTTLSLMIYNLSYSWGLDLRRSFEVWGLPDTEDVLESTIIGMLIIAVGFLITYIGNKLDIEFIGLLGLGVMFLGCHSLK